MRKIFLSVVSNAGEDQGSEYHATGFGVLWMGHGTGSVNGVAVKAGGGAFIQAGDKVEIGRDPKVWSLRFDLSWDGPTKGVPYALTEEIHATSGDILLRLDQVNFPPGATAYRHVHPGDGIRFLTLGELNLISDNHKERVRPGQAWFEPANSPVRAEASKVHPMSSFVRFMVLPPEYQGKPTIRILDPDEAALPRLQVTKRHVDKIVQLQAD